MWGRAMCRVVLSLSAYRVSTLARHQEVYKAGHQPTELSALFGEGVEVAGPWP